MKLLKKCLLCPYHLGIVKCMISPCGRCMKQKNAKHPFLESVIRRGAEYSKMTAVLRKHGKEEMYDD